jgi:rRNA maturation endonuclease Nob1
MNRRNEIIIGASIITLIAIILMLLISSVRSMTPRCLECKTVSYSTEYCGSCGEWMNPPYCKKCDRRYFSGCKKDKYCEDCGEELVTLTEKE